MPQPLVHVIVLNWNNHEETARCVDSVLRQTYPNSRILVVDNGSIKGGGCAALLENAPNIEIITLDLNTGYTGGNNIGMARAFAAGADYVWLLNSDAVAAPDTLAKLVEAAETAPDIGLVSPLLRERIEDPTLGMICGHFDMAAPSTEQTDAVAQARVWLAERPQRVMLYGAALLVRRALWEKIGGLDQRFFAYWEDVDYSVRSILSGFRNEISFDSYVIHTSKPTKNAPKTIKPHVYYYTTRNEILLWMKYIRGIGLLKIIWWQIRRQRQQINRMRDYRDGMEAILTGLWDGCRGVRGERPSERRSWMLRAAVQIALAGLNRRGAVGVPHQEIQRPARPVVVNRS